jgi:hypothetical protein
MHGVYTENSLCKLRYSVILLKREPWLSSPLKAHGEPQAAISSNWQLKLMAIYNSATLSSVVVISRSIVFAGSFENCFSTRLATMALRLRH